MNSRRKQKLRAQAERAELALRALEEISPDLLRLVAELGTQPPSTLEAVLAAPEFRIQLLRWADLLEDLRAGEDEAAQPWEPMEPAFLSADPVKNAEMLKMIQTDEIWMNNLYQVNVRNQYPADAHGNEIRNPANLMVTLSIKRRDKAPLHDWRHMQRIKNEIVGPECEAIEIYPAESRMVDTSNQYWLWCFPGDTEVFKSIGFTERMIMEGDDFGVRQRPFDDPKMSAEADHNKARLIAGDFDNDPRAGEAVRKLRGAE